MRQDEIRLPPQPPGPLRPLAIGTQIGDQPLELAAFLGAAALGLLPGELG